MHLDVQTLSAVTVFITALLGALLVFAGLQNGGARALMWWGAAHIVNASGLGLLNSYDSLPQFFSNQLANALLLGGYSLIWCGARVFDGRKVNAAYVVSTPALWPALCMIPGFAKSANLGAAVVSVMLALLALRTAQELWRGRAEPLISRWPAVIVLMAYAAVLLLRVPATLLSRAFGGELLPGGLSFGLLAFGTLLFTVVMAFLQLNLTKERTELKHRINLLVDPLSGVANRRAFLDGAAMLLARQERDREPLAVMLFDLDRLKLINEKFGHATGDAVLQCFASTATTTLGGDTLFARIGGEEFACCMPVGDLDEAYAIAERVRRNFAAAAGRFGNDQLRPSVSAGVTLGYDACTTLPDLLSVVDRALYRAKELGRNRVETEGEGDSSAGAPPVVPIIDDRQPAHAPSSARRWRAAS
jgi:diguanylate cyclase (GGDEF)-like protein